MSWLEADPARCELRIHMRRMAESERRRAAGAAEAVSRAFCRLVPIAVVGEEGQA
jgi:hypothetical protein